MSTKRNPIEWLKDRRSDFKSLSHDELAAILHFSLLWSFFEAEALDTRASECEILKLSRKLAGEDRLKPEAFASNLAYFRNRYVDNGEVTEHFNDLRLSDNRTPLVLSVLKGENKDPGDSLGALLLIIYRLRNNLFHGEKWKYGILDQFENFTNANEVLMATLDANPGSGRSTI
jgi:hypothetical protein